MNSALIYLVCVSLFLFSNIPKHGIWEVNIGENPTKIEARSIDSVQGLIPWLWEYGDCYSILDSLAEVKTETSTGSGHLTPPVKYLRDSLSILRCEKDHINIDGKDIEVQKFCCNTGLDFNDIDFVEVYFIRGIGVIAAVHIIPGLSFDWDQYRLVDLTTANGNSVLDKDILQSIVAKSVTYK